MKKLMVFGVSLIISLIVFLFMSSLVSAVRVNEVSPKTPEYVEIYNEDNEVLNLSEWKIRDNYQTDEIVCPAVNCSLVIDTTYFLILGNNTDISDITDQLVTYFYVDDAEVGNNLNDGGDNVTFFNSTFSTDFSYNNSESDKSWQFYNEAWQLCSPTPGSSNSCEGNGDDDNGNEVDPEEIYLELDWDEDDIVNGKKFDIEVKAHSLEDENYDIKIYIKLEDENIILSETYHEEDEEWHSGTYYVIEVINGEGDESETISLRIKEKYDDFSGEVKIMAKIRESGTSLVIDQVEEDIKILEKEEETDTIVEENVQEEPQEKISKAAITGNVIKLGNRKKLQDEAEGKENFENGKEEKILYESGSEKVKRYAIYALNLILIVIIIFLLKIRSSEKGFKRGSKKSSKGKKKRNILKLKALKNIKWWKT